jgi:flagella basal body P-ring formation protein FlgA
MEDADSGKLLRIHLPRTAQVKSSPVKLSQIAVITGIEQLTQKAGSIAIANIASAGQRLRIDRNTILSRLASNKIDAEDVVLTGAEKVSVTAKSTVIDSKTLLEKAKQFLEKTNKSADCKYYPTGIPESFTISCPDLSDSDIEIAASEISPAGGNFRRVKLDIKKDGETLADRVAAFRLKYYVKVPVAKTSISSGAKITKSNTEIKNRLSNNPFSSDISEIYGLAARRHIPAGSVIEPYMTGQIQPKLILKRNDNVSIKIESPGLLISTIGKAMQNGHQGELIKVKNVGSQKIIFAYVNNDGTVTPAY